VALVLPLAPAGPRPAEAALFGRFTVKDEIELGAKLNTLLRSTLPVIEDPEITGYVTDVVTRVGTALPDIPFPLRTTVVRNDLINAFAAPGGYVFVFTGLLHNFGSEAELAGVVAHELAHVSQRHVARRIENMQLVTLASLAGMVAGIFLGTKGEGNMGTAGEALMAGAMAGGQSAFLSYSRTDEREADQVGMSYLVEAGFPPQGMIGAFERIRRKRFLGGGTLPAYMSTHPDVEERLTYLDDRVGRLPEEVRARRGDDTRFRRVQTLVRARYMAPEVVLPFFTDKKDMSGLDFMGLGMVLERMGRMPQAAEAFEKAMAAAPADSLVLREAGRFRFKKGDMEEAGRLLQQAVVMSPHDVMALFYYARLLGESGRRDKAAEYYLRVLEKVPEDSEVHYHYGRLLGESGDLFQAHLHLAYGAVYGLDKKQATFHADKARRLAKSAEQKKEMETFESVLGARGEFW
jgi:predicted Zn-dependent protease